MDMRDPENWVLLYRVEDESSVSFAQAYRDHHALTDLQLLGLKGVPAGRSIDEPSFNMLKAQIRTLLQNNGQSPGGLILGYGMPVMCQLDLGQQVSLCSMLTQMTDNSVLIDNPAYVHAETRGELPGRESIVEVDHFLVADLAVERLEDALSLIQGAENLGHVALDAVVVSHLDADRDTLAVSPQSWLNLMDWQSNLAGESLALPFILRDESIGLGHTVEIFGPGLSEEIRSQDFMSLQVPPSPRALWWDMRQAHANPQQVEHSPCELAIQQGYVFAVGWVDAPGSNSLINPMTFFTALRYGATMAEATYLASPHLHHGLRLIGDPLYGLPFPQAMTTVRHADDRRLLRIIPKRVTALFDLSGILPEGDHRIILQKSDEYAVVSDEHELDLHVDAMGRAWLNTCPVGQLSADQVNALEIQLSWALVSEGSWRWPDRFEIIDLDSGELLRTLNAKGDQAFYQVQLGDFESGRTLNLGVQSARGEFYSTMKKIQMVMAAESGAVA